ncbi:ABC transporter permease subunit [Candidatus Fermentibacteria bacterium]|nr:ABC transporter permease subunit [Candidatus Fermentibacteria bacterium]
MKPFESRGNLGKLLGFLLPLALLLWWYLGTRVGGTVLPSPGRVLDVLLHPGRELLASGSLLWGVYVSISRIVLGFGCAALVGIPAGLVMGSSILYRRLLSLTVEMARPLSAIALLPLSIIVFKGSSVASLLGLSSLRYTRHVLNELGLGMIFILFWGGVFPIILGTMQGVRSVRNLHLEAARTLGAGRMLTFTHVMVPSALPDIFHGLRLGIGRCWMVIIAAEMLPGTNSGIGYLLRYSYQLSRYDIMLACVVVIALIGALFAKGLEALGETSLVLRSKER